MVAMPRRTKEKLVLATLRLVAQGGLQAVRISSIAKQAGVTDGAVYRHFTSKQELCWHAYESIIEQMIQEKQRLVAANKPIRQSIQQWIRLTFLYFDDNPEAFTYVLLTPHPMVRSAKHRRVMSAQGQLFMSLYRRHAQDGRVRDISPKLALCHLTGLMLNVPRLINEGLLAGPAMRYAEEVADSVWAILRPVSGGRTQLGSPTREQRGRHKKK